jgi:hypothetical protein
MSNIVPWIDQEKMAQAIAKSGLFGLREPNQVLALMAVAQAEGRHPASVARDYHIIEGRPALKADAMLARFQAAGGRVEWLIYTDEKVEATFTHPQGGELTLAWTFKQARDTGIAMGRNGPKDNWAKYPRAMLRARVISEGIRTVYPGVLVGEYTPEEVQDFSPGKLVDVTPPQMEIMDEIEEKVGTYPIYTPGPDGSDPILYSSFENAEDYKDCYFEILDRLNSSKKLSDAEKEDKRFAFIAVNAAVREEINARDMKELNDGSAED